MKKIAFTPAVPTTTVIISKENEKNMVVILESNGKHGSKKVLPGGRVKVGHHSWIDTGIIEANEEVGITNLKNIQLFALGSKPERDVREVTLEKYLDGAEVPTGIDEKEIEIKAHYGFDVILTASSTSNPIADGNEAKTAYYIDVFNFNPSEFALDHGELLTAYADYLKTGNLPNLNQF